MRRPRRMLGLLALLMVLAMIVLVIILPLGFLLGLVTSEAIKVGESVSPWVQDKLNHPDKVVVWLQGLLMRLVILSQV